MEKDIEGYLRERMQLLEKIRQMEASNNLNSREQIILEEVYNRLSFVENKILKFSGK